MPLKPFSERRMTRMSDLPEDLVTEILSQIPITSLGSVRSTCKNWNALSINRIFGKIAEAKNQFLGFMLMDSRICSLRMNLQGIYNDGYDFIDVSVKQALGMEPIFGSKKSGSPEVYVIYIIVLFSDMTKLITTTTILEIYSNDDVFRFKIYDFRSNSWNVLDVTPNWKISTINPDGVTLKGNAYFYAFQEDDIAVETKPFLLCFDFTSERFRPRLSMPFHCSEYALVVLSCVRDEQLSVLHQSRQKHDLIDIWVTNKIDYNEVSWTKWMKVDLNLINDFPLYNFSRSFFIDEKNKVALVFDLARIHTHENSFDQTVHIIREDGYFKSINVRGAMYQGNDNLFMFPPLWSSYVPSLVQIE